MAKKPLQKNIHPLERAEVTYVAIGDIHPNNYNPNRQSDRDFELLCRSIEEDGFTQPILVQKETNIIVDGEHRWRACKALGKEQVPVIYVDFTQEQMMISTLRHNRARGNEDINMAADVLRSLENLGKLDMAADSLMLDDTELKIMLQDIPQNELVLRNPGDQLTVAEVKDQLKAEEAFRVQKQNEDAAQAVEDRRTLSYILTYLYGEKQEIEQVIGKKHVQGLLALAKKYMNDEAALAYLDEVAPC